MALPPFSRQNLGARDWEHDTGFSKDSSSPLPITSLQLCDYLLISLQRAIRITHTSQGGQVDTKEANGPVLKALTVWLVR